MLDLGDGEAVAFKVESHNHPSAVEPFQGAATGVGGILRDVVAMGARPVALLDGLFFGAPDHHFERAVEGIGGYGNSVGVPTVGGTTTFDPAYTDNCLVNAMCVGLSCRARPPARRPRARATSCCSSARRPGATESAAPAFSRARSSARTIPTSVRRQIGDPFTGNKLIEASLELVERGLVASLQDCGAAGLASALSEMRQARHRRPARPRAAARGARALGDRRLRVAGADGRRAAGDAPRRRRGGLRALGARPRRDRRGDRHGRAPCFHGDDELGAILALLTDEAPR